MTSTVFTPLDNPNYIVHESRIDLWQFSLKQELLNHDHLLSPDEQNRANRFHFPKHRRRFATCRGALRLILGRYLNLQPEFIEFTYGTHGKPSVIDNTQKIEFNLSHTEDIALLAVGKKFPIGIDIEQYSARPYEGIAKNSFSEEEYTRLRAAPTALKAALFFHIWSQKEAFIKVSGLGLAYPTREFSVPTTIPTKQLINDPIHNTTWLMQSFMPQVACSAALCYHPTIREIRHGFIELSQNSLVF
jgi:4'-phosphopantetheinyl transferase